MYNSCLPDDAVVLCPYDKNHRIARSRIQIHIVKCEKNYPPDYKEVCPYNATHRVFKHELAEHITSCPTGRVLQSTLYQRAKKHGSIDSQLHAERDAVIKFTDEECWDEEDDPNYSNGISIEPTGKRSVKNMQCQAESLERDYVESKVKDISMVRVRQPRGFSEATMSLDFEDARVEDMESVLSVMAIGRGRCKSNFDDSIRRPGTGRGVVLPSMWK